MPRQYDVLVIGAGAAGLFCAIEAGKRGRRVLVIDHANKAGKKILMSGGGRCNFTNYHVRPEAYLSHNPHFCKSALSRYTQWDFIELVKKHRVPFHEKTLGQLFCDGKSQEIVDLLLSECTTHQVSIQLSTAVNKIETTSGAARFQVSTSQGNFDIESLVIATGGLSIPTMGASPFGYRVAEQFGLTVWPTRAGLVPLTLHSEDKERLQLLAGISVDCLASTDRQSFRENLLFTHRGLSGPAILQISSYWQPGEILRLQLLPDHPLTATLALAKKEHPDQLLRNFLASLLPKRFLEVFLPPDLLDTPVKSLIPSQIKALTQALQPWSLKPNATEGYRTAEVTLGGLDCDALSSKTMEAKTVPGLYFIGEVMDVTGWLGGYNFQWAWSSGFAAGIAC